MNDLTTIKKLFGGDKKQAQAISVINNPFSSKHIWYVEMHMSENVWTKKWDCEGSVSFKNGDTQGEQEFKADTLGELYDKIADFCENLG